MLVLLRREGTHHGSRRSLGIPRERDKLTKEGNNDAIGWKIKGWDYLQGIGIEIQTNWEVKGHDNKNTMDLDKAICSQI